MNDDRRTMIKFTDWLKKPEIGSLIFLIVLIIAISLGSSVFLTPKNILNILREISRTAIMAVGMAFIIISGGIDLSVGRIVGLTASVGAWTGAIARLNLDPALALLFTLLSGTIIGLINGLLVTRVGLPAFIATLGTSSITYGLALMVTNAMPIKYEATWITFFGSGSLGPIPFPIIIMFVIIALGYLISRYTVFGRNIYIIGNSEKAALLSGINVQNTRVIPYVISGFLSSIAGLILLGQLLAADATYGAGTELDVIAAAVIGGISMSGGEGNIIGVVIGAALMGVIKNAFILLVIPAFWQTICLGLVILLSVSLDSIRRIIRK